MEPAGQVARSDQNGSVLDKAQTPDLEGAFIVLQLQKLRDMLRRSYMFNGDYARCGSQPARSHLLRETSKLRQLLVNLAPGNEGSLPLSLDDKPLEGEPIDGLPNCGTTHLVEVAQLFLRREAVARAQRARLDLMLKAFLQLVIEGNWAGRVERRGLRTCGYFRGG